MFFLQVVSRKKKEKLSTDELPTRRVKDLPSIFFLSYESLNSRKAKDFLPTSYLQGQWKYGKAKEAIESARAGLSPQKRDARKSRKEKKRIRPRKARRWLQRRQGSVCPKPRIPFFLVHKYLG
jgi:hypothetical protein